MLDGSKPISAGFRKSLLNQSITSSRVCNKPGVCVCVVRARVAQSHVLVSVAFDPCPNSRLTHSRAPILLALLRVLVSSVMYRQLDQTAEAAGVLQSGL